MPNAWTTFWMRLQQPDCGLQALRPEPPARLVCLRSRHRTVIVLRCSRTEEVMLIAKAEEEQPRRARTGHQCGLGVDSLQDSSTITDLQPAFLDQLPSLGPQPC